MGTRGRSHKITGLALAGGYLGTIVAANWAIGRFGMVPVGFGLAAPAGVYFAGLAFTLRDLLHETLGRVVVAVAILAGAGLSFWVASPRIAVASAVAFGLSELADFAVFKTAAIAAVGGLLASADSFAWSYGGRRGKPCTHGLVAHAANCRDCALAWRTRVLSRLGSAQPMLPLIEVSAA